MIRVTTPSRLHLSLVDLEGGLGRVDGGIGLALEKPGVEVVVEKADGLEVSGAGRDVAEKVLLHYKLAGARVEVKRMTDGHVGLGSRTQLALAIAAGITREYGVDATTRELARVVGRGGTSGVGVSVFETGGFVLDGGHSRSEKKGFSPSRFSGAGPAPVLARYDVPEDWRFVCAIPRLQGAHGGEEKDVFERHCPIDAAEVGAVSRIILMKILPAMVERDIKSFGGGVSLLQGAGFKKLEVGLQEDVVGDLLDCLRAHTEGAGMSSFGPLCFGVASGDEKASEAEEAAREFLDAGGIESEVFVSKANNAGAKIEKS